MVCEQKKYRDNINSTSLAGLMIGALLFGNLADRYGRKALMISCCIGASIVCFLQGPLSQGSTDFNSCVTFWQFFAKRLFFADSFSYDHRIKKHLK